MADTEEFAYIPCLGDSGYKGRLERMRMVESYLNDSIGKEHWWWWEGVDDWVVKMPAGPEATAFSLMFSVPNKVRGYFT